MHRIGMAALLAAAGSTSFAQTGNFSYIGEIVSIQDDLGVFTDLSVGDAADGVIAFDPSGSFFLDAPGWASILTGDSISAGSAGRVFASNDPENVAAVAVNDFSSFQNDNPLFDTVDTLVVGSAIPFLEGTTYGSVEAFFEGESVWFQGATLPDLTTFGLENLIRAEVVIEFQFVEGFDPNTFDPNLPLPNGVTVVRSTAVIRINSIANNDGTIATIGCQALQFASPLAQRDFFDLSEFLNRYGQQDDSADMTAPFGTFNFFDVSEFLTQFSSSCTN